MLFKIETCSPESELDAYRGWFESWRKYLPWETKRDRIVGRLDRLSRRYREPFDPRVMTLEEKSPLFRRLLYCLAYHWVRMKDAPPTDDEATIRSLETQGRGGSNPLCDLTLVDALLAEIHENRTLAKTYLERRFGGFAVRTARQMGLQVMTDLDGCDWWLNAYYAMVGLNGCKPALGTYAGRAGIGTWIRRVVYSANRPSAASETLQSELESDDSRGSLSNAAQTARLSPAREAELAEFSAALEDFWRERSPLEKTLLLYWNEKTPKRFVRALNTEDYSGIWDVPVDDVREAYKLCGVGLKSKSFVLELAARRKEFLKKFELDENDAKTFLPLYGSRLVELARQYRVDEEDLVADVQRRFAA